MHAEVGVLAPVYEPLCYRVPEEVAGQAGIGTRVIVPLGPRRVVGVIVALGDEVSEVAGRSVRLICEVLDAQPALHPELVELALWAARYYLVPVGEVLRAALPAVLSRAEELRWLLTEAGRRALAGHGAALQAEGESLSKAEAAVLEALARRRGGAAGATAKGEGGPAVIRRLERRGFATRMVARRSPPRGRTELRARLVAGVDLAEAKRRLVRAPRQLALLEQIAVVHGELQPGALSQHGGAVRPLLRKLAEKNLVELEEVEVPRDPLAAAPAEPVKRIGLTGRQSGALEALVSALEREAYAAFLLHGVTGSGKTEVYLRLIAEAFRRGRTALVLVPEISLTPQLAARFRARFGDRVALLHSGLTDAERYDQWQRLRSGEAQVAVGARSAVFAPLTKLGVIVVDEEHDSSYKQQEGVRYSARDLALVRGKRAGAVVLLGSATPSLESRHGAETGRLTLINLPERVTERPLPPVELVDLRTYMTGNEGLLTAPLSAALEETLRRGEQAILFLNRRGYASTVICRKCGQAFGCRHCSVSLTHHMRRDRLVCHYCGYAQGVPSDCPTCKDGGALGRLGLGTERLEELLRERFPTARVARLDRDTASGRGMPKILAAVARREVDILVGTQMVTKGHDFPWITLVGVVCADLGLQWPDLRAAERTFQLLTQVAGRAGRGGAHGRVIIQTYNPDHHAVRFACRHDYEAFYGEEMTARRALGYPPCGHMAACWIDGPEEGAVREHADSLARTLRSGETGMQGVAVLGPVPAPIQRLKNRVRWLVVIRSRRRSALRSVLLGLVKGGRLTAQGSVRVTLDIDPQGIS